MYKYIVIEWIHWAGKSTIAQALASHLDTIGLDAKYYHFPEEKELFWQLIRSIVAEKEVYAHREVTGLLYAAFANRFHLIHKDTETTFVTDRHSVTTGLIFQRDMPMTIRQEIYKFGIEALQQSWVMIYLDIDTETARQRKQERDKLLANKWEVRKNKSNDKFTLDEFDTLSALYKEHLVPTVKSMWIPTHIVTNTGSVEQTVQSILQIITPNL